MKKKREKGKKRGISHENEEQQKSDYKKDLENKNTHTKKKKKREDEVDVERGSLEMAIAATFLQRDEIDIVPVATTSRRGCR